MSNDSNQPPPEYVSHELDRRTMIEQIRRRPAMYLGSIGFAGLATYIFSTFDLLINCGATFIDVAISGDDYEFKSDAQLSIGINTHGDFTIDDGRPGHMGFYSASLLFALSE